MKAGRYAKAKTIIGAATLAAFMLAIILGTVLLLSPLDKSSGEGSAIPAIVAVIIISLSSHREESAD